MNLFKLCLVLLLSTPILAQTRVECVRVISKSIDRQVRLPGELLPYLSVSIYARVAGFVDRVEVDRGSVVKKGQVLATLVAPETEAQIAEASSKAQAIQLQRAEAAAKLSSAQSTYDRLKTAAQTPGVVAGNDLVVAEKNVEATQALVSAYEGSIQAAEASVRSLKALEKYLTLTAPFDGIITDRMVHPGTLTGPNSGAGSSPLLKLEQLNRLRLTVAVPEAQVGGIVKNARVPFTLPGLPRRNLPRRRAPHYACAGTEDTHHACRAGCCQPKSQVGFGHVCGGPVAGAERTAGIARPADQHRHHDRTYLRHPDQERHR